MAESRETVLLTGFGPFPGVRENVTAELVPKLAKAARVLFSDYDIVDEVLPVAWMRAPERLGAILGRRPPRLALHFGVSSTAKGFRIEQLGRNVCAPRSDAEGALPAMPRILPTGPEALSATIPVDAIMARLRRADIPCCTSNDAGDYLCNAVLYQSLVTAAAAPRPFTAGFIHVPNWLSDASGPFEDGHLTWTGAMAGGLEIIAACLEGGAV